MKNLFGLISAMRKRLKARTREMADFTYGRQTNSKWNVSLRENAVEAARLDFWV